MADQKDPVLDVESDAVDPRKKGPTDFKSAEALIDDALQNPELSPAVKAALAPLQWYVNRLKHDIETLKAPFKWLESLREKVEAQSQKDQAWQRTVKSAELRPFDVSEDGNRIWVTQKPWQPDPRWVQIADEAAWHQEKGVRVWSNPSLRAIATEHEGGSISFVERYPNQAAFIQKLDAMKAPAREEER